MKTPEVKTVQETITPDRAKTYLSKNKRNRIMSEGTINAYALDMKNGNWLLNHQGIAFNERAELIDGQHRLAAIIRAGVPVTMFVTHGLRDEQRNGVMVNVMDTVDRNRSRTIGQQLYLFHGVQNACRTVAVLKQCVEFLTSRGDRLTTAQCLHLIKIYLPDIESIFDYPDANKKLPSFVAAPIVLLHNSDPETAKTFTTKFLTLEGLTASSPVRALLRWLEHHPNARNIRAQTSRVVASCLYHYKQGNSLTKVYASEEAANWLVGLQKANVRKIRELLNIAK